jgi:hypothetical protein
MARKALGIPKQIPIDTWVNDKATSTLEAIKGKADNLDGRDVTLTIRENTYRTAYERRVVEAGGNEPEGGGLYGSDRGGYTGGRVADIMGFADGGKVPGTPPQDRSKDNVLAMVNGRPLQVRSGEWIINEQSSKRYDGVLAAINAGTFPAYAAGGRVGEQQAAPRYFTPAPLGNGAGTFEGNLYLDSGEFLGKVRGVAAQVAAGVVAAADAQSPYKRAGR